MGFEESLDARVLYSKAERLKVGLSTGTVFPLSNIKVTIKNYAKLFQRYPEMGFFTFPLAYGSRDDPKKAYYITRNDTGIESRLLADEEIIWTAAKHDYDLHGKKASPHRLFWRIVGLTSEYEDDDTPTPINQRIRDLQVDLDRLSKIANGLPKEWIRTDIRVGKAIRAQLGSPHIIVTSDEPSIRDFYPTIEGEIAGGWIQARE